MTTTIIKLTFEQRQRAETLLESVIESPEVFAFELIALRDRVKELEATTILHFDAFSDKPLEQRIRLAKKIVPECAITPERVCKRCGVSETPGSFHQAECLSEWVVRHG